MTALALHFAGRRWAAIALAGVTMLVHPLMTLPALLLLVSLAIPLRIAASSAAAAVVAAFALPWIASLSPAAAKSIVILDLRWLESRTRTITISVFELLVAIRLGNRFTAIRLPDFDRPDAYR